MSGTTAASPPERCPHGTLGWCSVCERVARGLADHEWVDEETGRVRS